MQANRRTFRRWGAVNHRFDRPLLATTAICRCPSWSNDRSGPQDRRESGECRLRKELPLICAIWKRTVADRERYTPGMDQNGEANMQGAKGLIARTAAIIALVGFTTAAAPAQAQLSKG